MKTPVIEFLPKKYQEQRVRRGWNLSRLMVFASLLVVMLAVSGTQLLQLQNARMRCAVLTAPHDDVIKQRRQVALNQGKLVGLQDQARLLTFLGHPYPKSQVLAAVTNPLPRYVRITSLRIDRPTRPRDDYAKNEADDERGPGSPFLQDLKAMVEECRMHNIVVKIEGTTSDSGLLYAYLAELHTHPLVEAAMIESIDPERLADGTEQSRFTAVVNIDRGYLDRFAPRAERTADAASKEQR